MLKYIKTLSTICVALIMMGTNNALAQTTNKQRVEQYVVENIKFSVQTVKFLSDIVRSRDTSLIACTITFNNKGGVENVLINPSLDTETDKTFRSLLLLMPKGVYEPQDISKKREYLTVFFELTFVDVPIGQARDIELVYRGKNFFKVDPAKAELARYQPDLEKEYASTPEVNSTLWLIRSRATNIRVWARGEE